MGIPNRTETIQLIKRVLTLRNLVQTLERRTQDMQTEVKRFMDKFLGWPSVSVVARLGNPKFPRLGRRRFRSGCHMETPSFPRLGRDL